MNTNYHTQHAPFGAFASFTLGLHNAPGGFGIGLGGPAAQNIYVGFRRKHKDWQLLPFFAATKSLAEAFAAEEAPAPDSAPGAGYRKLGPQEFSRTLGWATDVWQAGPLKFSLISAFQRLPDEDALTRLAVAPLLLAAVDFDNHAGADDIEIIFGMSEPAQPPRPLRDTDPNLCGFATGRHYGYAARPAAELRALQGHTVLTPAPAGADGLQRIGAECALILRVPAGARGTLRLALGFHQEGTVTTGLPCQPYYLRHFPALEHVLSFGLSNWDEYAALAAARDAELTASRLNADQRWLLAQATHSYFGSTQLLDGPDGALWVVNEGEYRMINTFDLTVDHLFFELDWHPWAVRNTLDLFRRRYAYHDTLHTPDGRRGPGGLSFTHDMGVANQFTPPGFSSYECSGLSGCFSHMTLEQLTNWVLCATTYGLATGDTTWLAAQAQTLRSCAESLARRDDPDPARRDGLPKWDSDRCGTGAEITTYDSLDASLGQARQNLYLTLKVFGAWLLLEEVFGKLDLQEPAAKAQESARRLARAVGFHCDPATGFFPAVISPRNEARILPAAEGLVFPLYLGLTARPEFRAQFGTLLDQLERHLRQALQPGICLDPDSGGWKLSSSSRNTWFSKIALAQHVVRQLFPSALSPVAAAADRVHRAWEEGPGCGPFAMCDQIHSGNGRALGSRFYPRGVTAALWLREPAPAGWNPTAGSSR